MTTATETPTAEMQPGEWFTASDGNYTVVTDARYPASDEPTDWVPDADGNEVRKGDYVLVIGGRSGYTDKVVKVESVERTQLYSGPRGGYLPKNKHTNKQAWSPSAGNMLGIVYASRMHTGVCPLNVRKVNLTDLETKRLMLADLLLERSRVEERAANVQGEIVKLSIQERQLRLDIEALGLTGGA